MPNYSKKLWKVLKLIVIVLIPCIIIVVCIYHPKYIYSLSDPEGIKKFISSYGDYGILIFMLLQIVQVIVFFIPGEVLQVAGGFIYGVIFGSIFSVIGIAVGSIIIYYLSNIIGVKVLSKFISTKKISYIEKIIKRRSVGYIILIMYLIPGAPKDILGYICGIANVDFRVYFIYSLIGRIPGIVLSSYYGAKLGTGDRDVIMATTMLFLILLIIGFVKGKSIKKIDI